VGNLGCDKRFVCEAVIPGFNGILSRLLDSQAGTVIEVEVNQGPAVLQRRSPLILQAKQQTDSGELSDSTYRDDSIKVVIFGAMGCGAGVLRECLLDPDVETVLALVRNPACQRMTNFPKRVLENRDINQACRT
jgi:hypothetical protein